MRLCYSFSPNKHCCAKADSTHCSCQQPVFWGWIVNSHEYNQALWCNSIAQCLFGDKQASNCHKTRYPVASISNLIPLWSQVSTWNTYLPERMHKWLLLFSCVYPQFNIITQFCIWITEWSIPSHCIWFFYVCMAVVPFLGYVIVPGMSVLWTCGSCTVPLNNYNPRIS